MKHKRKLLRLLRKGSIGLVAEEVTFSACFTNDEAVKIEARRSRWLGGGSSLGSREPSGQDPTTLVLWIAVLPLLLSPKIAEQRVVPRAAEVGKRDTSSSAATPTSFKAAAFRSACSPLLPAPRGAVLQPWVPVCVAECVLKEYTGLGKIWLQLQLLIDLPMVQRPWGIIGACR